jgi:hypothetical protein
MSSITAAASAVVAAIVAAAALSAPFALPLPDFGPNLVTNGGFEAISIVAATLSIGLRDDNFFLNIDDISVRAVAEPATFAWLAVALPGIGMARRTVVKAPRQ